MLTIYGVYRSRASRNIWLAHELGLEFRHVPVIQEGRASGGQMHTRSPEFVRVNPNGQIPTMDDDGFVLHESLAINLYLARKHGGPLAPANLREEGEVGMWSLWAATAVEPHSLQILYNLVGKRPAERDAALAARSIAALRGPLAVLDAALAASGHVVGGRFTVADINLAEVVRYAMPAAGLIASVPRVQAWLAACQSRPAFRKMWAARDAEPA